MGLFKRIACLFNRHDYEVIQEFNQENRRIGCPNCKCTWGMNDFVKFLLPWDKELQEIYTREGYGIKPPRWKK